MCVVMHYESIAIIRAISLLLVIASIIGIIYIVRVKRLGWCVSVLPILLLVNTGLYYIDRILSNGFNISLWPISGSALIHPWSLLLRLQATLTLFIVVMLYIVDDKINNRK